MSKRITAVFVGIIIFLSGFSYSAGIRTQDNTVTETDVEVLLSKLPEDLQKENSYTKGLTAMSLLVGGYLYLVLDDYLFEKRMLKKEGDIVKWLKLKMPRKEWKYFGETHFSEIKKYIIYKSQPREVRRAFAEKVRNTRYMKKTGGALLFIAAAIGIEYLVSSYNNDSYKVPVSADRIEIKRILTDTAREHPEAFALSAYLMPYRKIVCSVIAEDETLYKLLKKQVDFVLSSENKEFTDYALKAARSIKEDELDSSLRKDLIFDENWFKNNWTTEYIFEDFKFNPIIDK